MFKLLLVFISLVSVNHAAAATDVLEMSPEARKNLSMSIKDVADNYEQLGKKVKAKKFYQSAIATYPIGDTAHQMANKINIKLDDQKTLTNLLKKGDVSFNAKRYKRALSYYLMAKELEYDADLMKKLAATYNNLGDTDNAEYYSVLYEQSPKTPVEGEVLAEEVIVTETEDAVIIEDITVSEDVNNADQVIVEDEVTVIQAVPADETTEETVEVVAE